MIALIITNPLQLIDFQIKKRLKTLHHGQMC